MATVTSSGCSRVTSACSRGVLSVASCDGADPGTAGVAGVSSMAPISSRSRGLTRMTRLVVQPGGAALAHL